METRVISDIRGMSFSLLLRMFQLIFLKIGVKILPTGWRFIALPHCLSWGYEKIIFCLYDLSPVGSRLNETFTQNKMRKRPPKYGTDSPMEWCFLNLHQTSKVDKVCWHDIFNLVFPSVPCLAFPCLWCSSTSWQPSALSLHSLSASWDELRAHTSHHGAPVRKLTDWCAADSGDKVGPRQWSGDC